MTDQQDALMQELLRHAKSFGSQFTYRSEYLGYLPYGCYHSLSFGDQQVSLDIADWSLEDLLRLQQGGFLKLIDDSTDPGDPLESTRTFEIVQTPPSRVSPID